MGERGSRSCDSCGYPVLCLDVFLDDVVSFLLLLVFDFAVALLLVLDFGDELFDAVEAADAEDLVVVEEEDLLLHCRVFLFQFSKVGVF